MPGKGKKVILGDLEDQFMTKKNSNRNSGELESCFTVHFNLINVRQKCSPSSLN